VSTLPAIRPDPPVRASAPRGVTPRAILVGLLLLPLNAFWLVLMEMATATSLSAGGSSGPYPTTFSLFANVVCFLVALSALNALLMRRWPRLAFSQTELLVIYIMLVIGTCITSVDFLDVLFPMLGHPTRYANATNRWQEIILPHLPRWFYVTDKDALIGWYLGGVNPYTRARLLAWLVPLAAWGSFIVVLLFVMLCVNVLLRRQWTRNEKLSYPVLQLPLDMTDPSGGFFRQRLMWAGFAVAGGISLLNGINVLYPSVPSIPVKVFDISPFFPNKPWNAIGWTPVSFYPFAIGLGFLLPADLLFSCWFFYFVWKAERVLSSVFGWSDYSPNYPYVNEQCFGGYMAIALIALWTVRGHLAEVVRLAWRGDSPTPNALRPTPDGDRPMSYRAALLGAVAGTIYLAGFFSLAGLGPWLAVAAVFIYFAIALACTRMRAELGPPAHDLHNGGPDYILTACFGTRAFSGQQLSVLTYFYWFNRAYRSLVMPNQLEAFKIGERKNIGSKGITLALVLSAVVGTLSGFWALYHFGYTRGVEARMAGHLNYFGWEAMNRLSVWIQTPRDTDIPAVLAISIGLGLTFLLQFARLRFFWWPIHPLGLAVSGSYSMNTIWLPLVIAWVCKVCLLRYGGLQSYRRALYFFMGLILGDYLLGCMWPLVGWILGVNTYSFQQ
jgi:hypothetical protein